MEQTCCRFAFLKNVQWSEKKEDKNAVCEDVVVGGSFSCHQNGRSLKKTATSLEPVSKQTFLEKTRLIEARRCFDLAISPQQSAIS